MENAQLLVLQSNLQPSSADILLNLIVDPEDRCASLKWWTFSQLQGVSLLASCSLLAYFLFTLRP
jgi:hypothetical protein